MKTKKMIKCTMCGHRFNPDDHIPCEGCPVQSGCQLVCCPSCGYETVDPEESKVVQLVSRLFSSRRRPNPGRGEETLANVLPGCRAKVIGYSQSVPRKRKTRLQAYGLVPGHEVQVVQHSPVTVVQIEHMELALEGELASQISVEEVA